VIARVKWWAVLVLDVAAVVCTSAIAGVVFGVYAFREDLRFAWRRPRSWQ
jgi:hypothetical protein